MKSKLIFFIIFTFCRQVYAQSLAEEQLKIEQKIIRSWVKYRIDAKDGSQLQDENVARKTASMIIFKKGGGSVVIFGSKAIQARYAISSNIIVIDGTRYAIEKLTDYELAFSEINENKLENELIRYQYMVTTESSGEYFYRQFIKPFVRTLVNGDTAYAFNEHIFPTFKNETQGYLVPLENFDDTYEASYNFIEKHFAFPAKKKGNFSVSFSVGKKGEVKDAVVKVSSDSSYNERLIQAVYQTQKNWKPAEYNNKKVEILFNYVFRYDAEGETIDNFDTEVFLIKKERANRFFEKKEYIKAIKLYTECILMQDEDIEPLFKRAESYFALKVNKNACLDWSYLAQKGQKKAEKLFMDNCMK
ncbi:hypothetical protein VB796_09565 [Arcicella sp. LKC2W]|uniref:hypothetical protein n=1 Tax=Arcicella sp. LKC2W TaxID=2984198 RepID=UPI002B2217BF|nr:hypothetical protein [Arcicella sp. LKC2W]MEA5459285.1 hypothetical protein [Arcicella sp. LKC2W]